MNIEIPRKFYKDPMIDTVQEIRQLPIGTIFIHATGAKIMLEN